VARDDTDTDRIVAIKQLCWLAVSSERLESAVAERVSPLAEARRRAAEAERRLTVTKFNADAQRRALARGSKASHLVDPRA